MKVIATIEARVRKIYSLPLFRMLEDIHHCPIRASLNNTNYSDGAV